MAKIQCPECKEWIEAPLEMSKQMALKIHRELSHSYKWQKRSVS
jgi:hypothetical protein